MGGGEVTFIFDNIHYRLVSLRNALVFERKSKIKSILHEETTSHSSQTL
jgi:hypothetical protein